MNYRMPTKILLHIFEKFIATSFQAGFSTSVKITLQWCAVY